MNEERFKERRFKRERERERERKNESGVKRKQFYGKRRSI